MTTWKVTTETHKAGDMREFAGIDAARLYAGQLVELGFEPVITHYLHGEWVDYSWDDLITAAGY